MLIADLPEDNVQLVDVDETSTIDENILAEFPDGKISLFVIKGVCLNTECYRGFSPAKVISAVSQADEFNQESNPEGTQRDLNDEKARRAWRYMDIDGADPTTDRRLFTEVLLNVREDSVAEIVQLDEKWPSFYRIDIFVDRLSNDPESPDISRVEGNHRLTYARGTHELPPIEASISFCLTFGIDRLMEAKLFRDINANQQPMNTSHLANLGLRLGKVSKKDQPSESLIIADRLADDAASAFYKKVDRGGAKEKGAGYLITLKTLESVVKQLISKSDELSRLKPKSSESFYSVDEKYKVILSYWNQIANLFPDEWSDKKSYLLRGSAGMLALAMAGAHAIDELLAQKQIAQLSHYLHPLKTEVSWVKKGTLEGLNGVGGANKIFTQFLRPFLASSSVTDAEIKQQLAEL